MSIYFYWEDKPHTDLPEGDPSYVSDILSIKVSHTEAIVPQAWVCVKCENNIQASISPGRQGCIVFINNGGRHILFRGTLATPPKPLGHHRFILGFQGLVDPNYARTYEAFLADAPATDPLFLDKAGESTGVPARLPDTLPDHLEVLPHWCRITGQLSFTPFQEGGPLIDLGERAAALPLHLSWGAPPITDMHIKLRAEWMQEGRAHFDLGACLGSKGDMDFFQTLSPQRLRQIFNGLSQQTNGTGLRLRTPRFTFEETGQLPWGADEQTLPLYTGQLHWPATWRGQQKRVETLALTYRIQVDTLGDTRKGAMDTQTLMAQRRPFTLDFPLNDVLEDRITPPWIQGKMYAAGEWVRYGDETYIAQQPHESQDPPWLTPALWTRHGERQSALPSPQAASFFDTARGPKAAAYALTVAKHYSHASLRCLKACLTLPFSPDMEISCGHRLRLVHPLLPGGEGIGTVMHYEIQAAGGQPPQLTLQLGFFQAARFLPERDLDAAHGDLDGPWVQGEGFAYAPQTPCIPLCPPHLNVVSHVEAAGIGLEAERAYLATHHPPPETTSPDRRTLWPFLKPMPWRLDIQLMPPRISPALERHYAGTLQASPTTDTFTEREPSHA